MKEQWKKILTIFAIEMPFNGIRFIFIHNST
jgi:hypothetical protein